MQISTRRFKRQLEEVDSLNRAAMRSIYDNTAELSSTARSRRSFVQKAAVGGAVAGLGGLAIPSIAGAQEADAATATATLLASFEKTAVEIYTTAAGAGLVPEGPLLDAATLFLNHHDAHGQAFAAIVGIDYAEIEIIQSVFDDVVAQATAPDANVLLIAALVEKQAGDTYLDLVGQTDTAGNENMKAIVDTMATIAPVEYTHNMLLLAANGGDDPVTPVVGAITSLQAFGSTDDSLVAALTA